ADSVRASWKISGCTAPMAERMAGVIEAGSPWVRTTIEFSLDRRTCMEEILGRVDEGLLADGHEEVGRGADLHSEEFRWSNSDDGEKYAIHIDALAGNGRVGIESAAPVVVAQDGDRAVADGEGAADHRRH